MDGNSNPPEALANFHRRVKLMNRAADSVDDRALPTHTSIADQQAEGAIFSLATETPRKRPCPDIGRFVILIESREGTDAVDGNGRRNALGAIEAIVFRFPA